MDGGTRRLSDRKPNETLATVLAASIGLASLAPLGWLQARPQEPTEVAAVFAPWIGAQSAFFRVLDAGGLVVRQGLLDSILVVRGTDAGLIERLYAAGAVMVIDPRAFGGCLVGRPAGLPALP